jgi:ribonuclease P protein component
MSINYPKSERLKKKNTIDLLFAKGKSVSKYPLRLVYVTAEGNSAAPIQIGVSVSKKYFKKAADRNYYKRVLRETFRLNKDLITESTNEPYAMMFLYQSADRISFEDIQKKTIQLFEKFVIQVNAEKT